MATTQLYSVQQGKLVDFKLDVDQNGEIVASTKNETLKFPAGLSKAELNKLFKAHNEANDGLVGLTEEEAEAGSKEAAASQKLIDSL